MDFDHSAIWARLPIPDDRRQELYQKALTFQIEDAKRQEEKKKAAKMDEETWESKEQKDEGCWPSIEENRRRISPTGSIQPEGSLGEPCDITMGTSYHHAPNGGE
jgi:hypothetical protein